MDSVAGPAMADRSPEPIISITHHYAGSFFLGTLHYFCLIITEKRVICVRTDDLLSARRKDVMDGKITVPAGPLGYLMTVLSLDRDDVDFSKNFRKMHPSSIAAAYPDAAIVPVNGVVSFEVWEELARPIDIGDTINTRWALKISGHHTTIELYTRKKPLEILENYRLRRLFAGRFRPPTKNMIGWLFGEKTE
jgi:hypothetical protein